MNQHHHQHDKSQASLTMWQTINDTHNATNQHQHQLYYKLIIIPTMQWTNNITKKHEGTT
jgi:hypothetical protein